MLEWIYIYDAPDAFGLNIVEVGRILAELLPETQVETRTDFFTWQLGQFELPQVEMLTDEIAARLEEREAHNLVHPDLRADTEPITPEERDLGAVYLAKPLQEVMRPLVPQAERGAKRLHLAFITQSMGEFRPGEALFRLRIVQHGEPAIISTTGFFEALELPREYTFRRAQLIGFGMDEAAEELDEQFASQALRYGDEEITRVATGYALQAVFYRLFGEDGCARLTCPLHQVRTHDELFEAHLSPESKLCERHARMLAEGGRGPAGR